MQRHGKNAQPEINFFNPQIQQQKKSTFSTFFSVCLFCISFFNRGAIYIYIAIEKRKVEKNFIVTNLIAHKQWRFPVWPFMILFW